MKKSLYILFILIIAFNIFGCSNNSMKENSDDVIQNNLEIARDDEDNIQKIIDEKIKDSPFEGAKFQLSIFENKLRINIVKSVIEVSKELGALSTQDLTVKFESNLIFDEIYKNVKVYLNQSTEGCVVFLYNDEDFLKDDKWTVMKNINDK